MAIFEVITAGFEVSKSRFNAKPGVVVKQRLVDIGKIGEQVPHFWSRRLSVSAFLINHEIMPAKPVFLSDLNVQILFADTRGLRQVVKARKGFICMGLNDCAFRQAKHKHHIFLNAPSSEFDTVKLTVAQQDKATCF